MTRPTSEHYIDFLMKHGDSDVVTVRNVAVVVDALLGVEIGQSKKLPAYVALCVFNRKGVSDVNQ